MVSGDISVTLRPIDLARAVNISTASVRFYEREGFLPAADRRQSGHRAYSQVHLDALVTSRSLIRGYGWQYALRVMQVVHAGDLDAAMELVDARHAVLDRERREIRATVDMLEALTAELDPGIATPALTRGTSPMKVGDAARWGGVTVPTLRFWEEEGLIQPARIAANQYRVYQNDDLVHLRVVATLRRAGYGIPHIRGVIEEVRHQNIGAALREVQQRLEDLATASRDCLLATAALASYVTRWCEDPDP
jgi:DNA-binding transcriptional MerR regulator